MGAKEQFAIRYDPYKETLECCKVGRQGDEILVTEKSRLAPYVNNASSDGRTEQDGTVKNRVLFANCVDEVVRIVDEEFNPRPEGLEILFSGTTEDYRMLSEAVAARNSAPGREKKGPLTSVFEEEYLLAKDAIQMVREAYERVQTEFRDFLPGQKNHKKAPALGDLISRFLEVTSPKIPICFIGVYSAGKSTLLNALIGRDILAASIDPCTRKNTAVTCGDAYTLSFSLRTAPETEETRFDFCVEEGKLRLLKAEGPDSDGAPHVEALLQKQVGSALGNDEALRAVSGFLNSDPKRLDADASEEKRFLTGLGDLISLSVPFCGSGLGEAAKQVVFYDMPGSNNAGGERDLAVLKRELAAQSNALPVFVCKRDELSSDDNKRAYNLLRTMSDRLSVTNCIIVITRCDGLSQAELEEKPDSILSDWFGGKSLLYTSARRDKDTVLPDLTRYNQLPCPYRRAEERRALPQALRDTGIPALEEEILYYIKYNADYRKCRLGREWLLDALRECDADLKMKREKLERRKAYHERKKAQKRDELLAALKAIRPEDLRRRGDAIEARIRPAADVFLEKLPAFMEQTHASLRAEEDGDAPATLKTVNRVEDAFNSALTEHCLKELLVPCYYGRAKEEIENAVKEAADAYLNALSEFADKNAKNMTKTHVREIRRIIRSVPFRAEMKDPFSGFRFNEAVVVIKSLVKKDRLVENYLKEKEKKLKSFLMKKRIRRNGQFREQVIDIPLAEVREQFNVWAENLRSELEDTIDKKNSVLSGIEKEIADLEEEIEDVGRRLENCSDVRGMLMSLTSPHKPEKTGQGEENNG